VFGPREGGPNTEHRTPNTEHDRREELGHIVWSEDAAAVMKRLDPALQQAIRQRTEYLQLTPRMYALTRDERFPGCRSFWADGHCHVYYMVAAGGDDCYIMAVEETESEEESGLTRGAGSDQEE
jgi:hypothetical protein